MVVNDRSHGGGPLITVQVGYISLFVIQHRIFVPQNAEKTRDKLPYRELFDLKLE